MSDPVSISELRHDEQQSAKDADAGRLHEAALDDVLTCVMSEWEWPRRINGATYRQQFSLFGWMTETMDSWEIAVLAVAFMDDVTRYDSKMSLERKLRAHLSTSDIVAERVAVLAAQEKLDHE